MKPFILALAATTAIASPALATDLPQLAEPIRYVEACDAHGKGYFRIPGSSTCLKLGGYARTQFTSYNLLESYGVTQKAKDAVTHEEGLGIFNDNTPTYSRFAKVTYRNAVGDDPTTAKYLKLAVNKDGHILGSDGKALVIGKEGSPLTVETYDGLSDLEKDGLKTVVIDESTIKTVEDQAAQEEERNDNSYYARFLMHLTTMTETELATIKTYAEFYATWSNSGDDTWNTGILYTDIDLGAVSLHLGYDQSLFAPFIGYTGHLNSLPVGYAETWQANATFDLGSASTIAFGVESAEYADGAPGGIDFTGAFKFDLAPLSFGTMAIAHAYDSGKYGYGVTAYVTSEVTDKLSVGVGGTYGENILTYLTYLNPAELEDGNLSGYNVFAGIEYQLTDKLSTAVDGGYTALEVDGASYDLMGVNANVKYEPVSGLTLLVEGGWYSDSMNNESANVVGRVQFSF